MTIIAVFGSAAAIEAAYRAAVVGAERADLVTYRVDRSRPILLSI